ncbi:MAG TPA: methyltransferase domain-containing protein [Thermotogota bacterium]|nr:methyltransferase domain-containing protein [Thermotogota bacterium]HPJ87639.1 methyltransferase domain-containing protein [Thermotogota bacterium]HPR94923.1 methyltransferase domain-containing protein [Thermotogota bacterium]
MKKDERKNRIQFYLDTSVMPVEQIKLLIDDYFYWFNPSDRTDLIFFTSTRHPQELDKILTEKKREANPKFTFIREPIKPEDLHRFYTQRILLNEWVNYKKNDLFRIYKLFFPANSDINFDNQAISIQYDIRYHLNRSDAYASYKKEHLSAIESAIHFYQPELVFDLGCGAGAQYFFLKGALDSHNTKYQGIDLSRFQTLKAIDLFESDRASFSLGNAVNLKFKDHFADFSFSESTFPFLHNPLMGLKEINRISKKGFFAALYTIRKRHEFLKPFKKNNVYALDTGATWKYLNGITPNIYYLPEYLSVMELSKTFSNTIVIEENSDQFFEPLGVSTSNLFFFPAEWYKKTKNKFLNFRPLM